MNLFRKSAIAATTATALLTAPFVQAATVDIDFSSYAVGTAFSTQIAGVTFSLMGGPGTHGAPVTDGWGNGGLSNSDTGDYPTAAILDVKFSGPARNINFNFENYSSTASGNGATYYAAYSATGALLESAAVGGGGYFALASSGIVDLQFNNNSGNADSWLFDVRTLHADVATVSAVPEPETYAMLLAGLGLTGFMARRKYVKAAA